MTKRKKKNFLIFVAVFQQEFMQHRGGQREKSILQQCPFLPDYLRQFNRQAGFVLFWTSKKEQ
jgi:hypothetical protein